MSWSRSIREKVRNFVTAATGGPWPQMRQQAQRLLDDLPPELPPGAAPRPAPGARAVGGGVDKSGLAFAPPSSPTRAERNAPRNTVMRDIRIAVMRRAAGRCEFRCVVLGEPTEAHHIFGGSSRRELESEYTVAAICDECHDKCDASPAWAREQGLAFARRMADAARSAPARGDGAGIAAVAGFTHTAAMLEARIALAAAQERKPCQS